MKSLTAVVMVTVFSAWGCGSENSGDNTGAGGTINDTTTVVGGAGSTATGGNTMVIGGASSGGATSLITTGGSSTANTTTSNSGDYDTTISEGEFSFFVISWTYIQSVGGDDGLGGNLGGLAGADAHCSAAAKNVDANDKHLWKAFLSQVTDSATGATTVNAIDRIGKGPWYSQGTSTTADDGLLLSQDLVGLKQLRPNGSTEIVLSGMTERYRSGSWPFNQCLTDEYGKCPLGYTPDGDNHDILTGCDANGNATTTDMSGSGTAMSGTCNNWTNDTATGAPIFGHIWPRQLNSKNVEMASWIYVKGHGRVSCGQAVNQTETMSVGNGVGAMGGYGAFYCFAVSQ